MLSLELSHYIHIMTTIQRHFVIKISCYQWTRMLYQQMLYTEFCHCHYDLEGLGLATSYKTEYRKHTTRSNENSITIIYKELNHIIWQIIFSCENMYRWKEISNMYNKLTWQLKLEDTILSAVCHLHDFKGYRCIIDIISLCCKSLG